MPHPALHLTLARRALDHWTSRHMAPFDVRNPRAVNAFMFGSLAPDMGHFPGGDHLLGHAVHTRRTGEMQRALLDFAHTEEEWAFAWGWLTHVIADVVIHPLVNSEAARRSRDGKANLAEHVRVEVGLDIGLCSDSPMLQGFRLEPALDRAGYGFVAGAIDAVLDMRVTTGRLMQMQRGLLMFSRGALHFVTTLGRQLCWNGVAGDRVSLAPAVLWYTASRLSPRDSMMRAYLSPYVPEPSLVRRVEDAIPTFDLMMDDVVVNGAGRLPDYNLEDGSVIGEEPDLRVA